MPLDPSKLTDELVAIDESGPPKDIPAAIEKWADAWAAYVKGATRITPASATPMRSAFKSAMAAAFIPAPVPITFPTFLEAAMRAGWAAAITTPPGVSITPAPAPFAPTALAAMVAGLASPDKKVGRAALAAVIHTWTITHIVVGPDGPSGPVA